MGTKYKEIIDIHKSFIENQKIFFVATAGINGRVNISPKGMDSFRIVDTNRVLWLNLTGSGNETATHIQENSRMTIMFVAFEGKPMILRLYGNAKVIHKNDPEWSDCITIFPKTLGARQIFDVSIDLVQKSCGMSVPIMEFVEERTQLNDWAEKVGENGIEKYWKDKNQFSIDGLATNIIKKNIDN